MNKFKKTMCLLLSVSSVCATAAGCGGGGGGGIFGGSTGSQVVIDPNKTQIYVGVTSQGINETWIYPVIERFEEEYTDYQVIVDPLTDKEQSIDDFAKNMPTSRDDLFFLQGGNCPFDWIDEGYIEDITDVVTVGDPNIEEGTTIESKIMDHFKENFQYKPDGEEGETKYYFLPYVLATTGLIYDHALFEEKNLLSLNGFKGIDGQDGTADDGYGPDGAANTYDDGLPATWEDFKVLLDAMVNRGVTPFVWSGQHASYRNSLAKAILANYEGSDQYALYNTLNGVDQWSGETITRDNGWKLASRPSKKAMLTMVGTIVQNTNYFAPESFYQSTSHLQAQNEFILSCRTDTPIGMLVEGGWWENEAKGTFDEMERYGDEYGYGKRDFKYMPLPKFIGTAGITDQTSMANVMYSEFTGSTVCMNKASKNKEAAKLFLRYAHTDISLRDFTLDNGLVRPYDYDFDKTSEEWNSLSKYARSIWEAVHDENTEIADGLSLDEWVKQNSTVTGGLLLSSKIGTTTYADPFKTLYDGFSVNDYYTGMSTLFTATEWQNRLP